MRGDADFVVYVGARWPSLLHEAVLLGCPPELAAEVVTDALARSRREWARAQREEGVEQLVREELTRACARRPRATTSEEQRREQADQLPVLSPPSLGELRDHERARRLRTGKRVLLVLVPIVLVAGGLTWWTNRAAHEGQQPELGPAALTRAENPAGDVTWWANGMLHLDHVTLAVDGLRDMTRLGNGVVYGDDEGRVVYLADDGSRSVLGHKDPDVPVAATDENGVAAWFDPGADQVVAVTAETGRILRRTGVGDHPRVVAVDGDAIYLVGEDGSRALLRTGPDLEVPVSPAGILDVRSRVRAFQVNDSTIQVVQSYFDVSFDLPGRGASLSPDGLFVVSQVGVGDDAEPVVYDTRSGAELPTGLATTDVALASAAEADAKLAFIVAQGGVDAGRDLQLRVCELRVSLCRILARIPEDGSTPVLAR